MFYNKFRHARFLYWKLTVEGRVKARFSYVFNLKKFMFASGNGHHHKELLRNIILLETKNNLRQFKTSMTKTSYCSYKLSSKLNSLQTYKSCNSSSIFA